LAQAKVFKLLQQNNSKQTAYLQHRRPEAPRNITTTKMQSAMSHVRRFLQIESAQEFKDHVEKQIADLQHQMEKLSGKENHKERAVKGKMLSQLRASPRYIDACRVVRGAQPSHGHFLKEASSDEDGAGLAFEDAAAVAADVEKQLKELAASEPVIVEEKDDKTLEGRLENKWNKEPHQMMKKFVARTAALEEKAKAPADQTAPVDSDQDELEELAREVVWYREKLVKDCGYRNKDLHDDPDLRNLETRLDKLSDYFFAERKERPAIVIAREEDALRAWEQNLMSRLAVLNQSTAGLSPSATKEAERLMNEISEIKARQASQGLTDGEQDRSEEVWLRIVRLMELRQKEFHDKKHDCRESRQHKALRAEVQQLHEKLQEHKKRLREELGLSAKDIKRDSTIQELEERFRTLCGMGGA